MEKKYQVFYVDPPWKHRDSTFAKRKTGSGMQSNIAPELRYPTMSMSELKTLQVEGVPIQELAAPDAALFLWTTGPKMNEAVELLDAWGFRYVSIAFVWHKLTKNAKERTTLARWTLGSTEFVLMGRKGKIKPASRKIRQFVEAEVKGHSAKPEEVRRRIEQLLPDLPKIELFHRGDCPPGWDCWGNESRKGAA